MKLLHKSKQQGMSFIGLILIVALLAGIGVLAAQAFPTFMEYQAVLKAVDKVKTGGNAAEIRANGRRFVETERNWKNSVSRYVAPYGALTVRS